MHNPKRTSTEIVAHIVSFFYPGCSLQYAHKIQCNFIACTARQVLVQWAAPKCVYTDNYALNATRLLLLFFRSFFCSFGLCLHFCVFFPSAHLLFYIFHWQFFVSAMHVYGIPSVYGQKVHNRAKDYKIYRVRRRYTILHIKMKIKIKWIIKSMHFIVFNWLSLFSGVTWRGKVASDFMYALHTHNKAYRHGNTPSHFISLLFLFFAYYSTEWYGIIHVHI